LSDTTVYEPSIRALLGTASHFCEVVVLKLRPTPQVVLHEDKKYYPLAEEIYGDAEVTVQVHTPSRFAGPFFLTNR